MDAWYIVVEGKPAGPYTFEELKTLNIQPGTFIKASGMDDYKEAHEIPEVRQLLGFKHPVASPQYFATLDLRLLAIGIDYLLVVAVCSCLTFIVAAFAHTTFMKGAVSEAGIISVPVFKFIYSCIMEASSRQGTLGKFWLGLKVCDEQGVPLSSARAIARNAAKLLSLLTLGLGYFIGFFDKRQQCLHDRLAGTLVIKDRLI